MYAYYTTHIGYMLTMGCLWYWLYRLQEHVPVNVIVSNSSKCMGVNGEALQLHAVYIKLYILLQVHENPYQVVEVTRTASEHAMKLKVHMIKPFITIAPSYTRKISLVCCRWHCHLYCTLVTIWTATNLWYFLV